MCNALAVKPEYKTVPVMELETIIALTLKMLVLNAKVIILFEQLSTCTSYLVLISIILPSLNLILELQLVF